MAVQLVLKTLKHLHAILTWMVRTCTVKPLYLYLAHIYITDNWFDPPSDITAIPQSYTVHCVIIGEELEAFHYYYHDTPESELTSTYCSSQTGYNCSLANNTVITNKTSDNVVDKTITVTWEAEEISSGAFRQDSNHGDHKIGCYAKQSNIERELLISVKGKYNTKHLSLNIFTHSSIIVSFRCNSSQ